MTLADIEGTGLEAALNVCSRGFVGIGWRIPQEWVDKLIAIFDLNFQTGHGDMSGEKHALFTYNDITIRLKYEFPQHWCLYKDEWKPDPHWTGD